MPTIHLNGFKKSTLAYQEKGRRFCFLREKGTRLSAFNIDISGPGDQYFKSLYTAHGIVGYQSADGIYVGSFHKKGKQIHFVCVLELEGNSEINDPFDQVVSTLDHFCKYNHNGALEDDGHRHHFQAKNKPRPYLFTEKHFTVGIIIGSRSRTGLISTYHGVPIICLNSRQPDQDITPKAFFDEISKYTGQIF